jgi:hypothetical protein
MYLLENVTHGDEGKLYVQDALVAIAVCAAKVDEEYSPEKTDRIAALALANPLFSKEIETVKKRVYHFVHSITPENREQALDLAMTSLPADLKETAFAWAADMIVRNRGLTDAKKEFLDELATQLSIKRKVAARILKEAFVIQIGEM